MVFGLVEQTFHLTLSYSFPRSSLRVQDFDENYKRLSDTKNVTDIILLIKYDVSLCNKWTSWVIAIFPVLVSSRDSWPDNVTSIKTILTDNDAFLLSCVERNTKLELIGSNWNASGRNNLEYEKENWFACYILIQTQFWPVFCNFVLTKI